jgi:crossover junction endodeoxyribonuclease RuvC
VLVLGIDPGSRYTGYGLIDKQGDRMRAIEHGRFSCSGKVPLPTRLHRLASDLAELIDRARPDAVALETTFHGINSRSLIVLAQARGALLATVASRGLEIREYSPAEVKSAVSGNGRAGKDQVARMVRLILRLEGEASADATDALAVAICCAQRHRLEALSTGARG